MPQRAYEARALGVHSATPTMTAARPAPDAVLLPVGFDPYRRFSRRFEEAVRSIAPQVQDVGIDGVHAQVSSIDGDAAAKLLAKLASDMNTPDGVTVLTMADGPTRIRPMPARKVNDIGCKVTARLASLGIDTVGQIAARDPA